MKTQGKIRLTASLLALLAIVFYVSFYLVMAAK